MLVNMSTMKHRQINSSVNGTFASLHGMFAFKISYSSPTLVSVLAP